VCCTENFLDYFELEKEIPSLRELFFERKNEMDFREKNTPS
jgi:hypothetical protein